MRIRTIKPEFWQNEELSEVSETSALLAIGLLNFSDDEGYFRANPKLISAAIFPLRETSITIQSAIDELAAINYIKIFTGSDGKRYGRVSSFKDHQVINRPKASKFKKLHPDPEQSVMDHGTISDESVMDHGTIIREGKGTGNREQGTGKGTGKG